MILQYGHYRIYPKWGIYARFFQKIIYSYLSPRLPVWSKDETGTFVATGIDHIKC